MEIREIKEIKYLLALAACGSVSAAAELLYVSQPSLSQFLKQYEDGLGAALFVREPSGIKPTKAGERFFGYLREIEKLYKAAQEEVHKTAPGQWETVRLGLPAAKNALYLSELLKMFREKHPQCSVNIQEACSAELEERLARGEIDAAVISSPLNYDGFFRQKIAQEEIFLATPAFHNSFQASEHYVEPGTLHGKSFVLLDPGSRVRKFTDLLLKNHNIQVKEAYAVNNIAVALDLVAQGVGYTIVPESQRVEQPQIAYYRLGKTGIFRDTLIVWGDADFETLAQVISETIICASVKYLPPKAGE